MTDDVGDRIQRRILSEVRQELVEAQRAIEQKDIEIRLLEIKIKDLIKSMHDLPVEIEKRDHEIAMLQKRLANLNDEMNGRGIPTAKANDIELEEMLKKSKRHFTTLEDVYKLTGESYTKDERC